VTHLSQGQGLPKGSTEEAGDAITNQMSTLNSRNTVATDAFIKFCDKAMEEKAQKMMMREQKLRA